MKKVTIRHCPLCPSIDGLAKEAATAIRRVGGLEMEMEVGAPGEFTVLVDGQEVIRNGDGLPSVVDVVAAVEGVVLIGRPV
jgi:hypothetical protein